MKRILLTFVASAALAGGAPLAFAGDTPSSGSSSAASQHLKLSELPLPVRDSIKSEAQSQRVSDIRKTTDAGGNDVFKAEIGAGKHATELTVSPEGKILDRMSNDGTQR